MVREAAQHAAEDRRRRELVEARNQADALTYTAEKQLQEHGARVGDTERKAVEDAVSALRDAVSGDDLNRIRQRTDALSQALTRFGEAVQRVAAAPGADQAASGGSADDVVDAEFEEVDRRKHG
jgi:molecular chaperone DnaK